LERFSNFVKPGGVAEGFRGRSVRYDEGGDFDFVMGFAEET
jgi:hypothetical protein